MEQAGAVHVGGRCVKLDMNGTMVVLGGNELPWYKPAADFGGDAKLDVNAPTFRLLLAHSPDQFGWAVQRNVHLMLAGHLHGGQICFPLLGAITSPSIHGVRYVGGVHRERGTVMHVSRGVSSLMPLRVNCPPEIAVLTLRQEL
jgi:predicted MPP superfamily phosphohydrolase